MVALPPENLYYRIAVDHVADAHLRHKNWAAGWLVCALDCGLEVLDTGGQLQRANTKRLQAAEDAVNHQRRQQAATCESRCAPSDGVKLCTYQAWFARPTWARGRQFWQLPPSMPQLRAIVRLRLGSHTLPVETGSIAAPPAPRQQRLCQCCDAGAPGDERHMLLECHGMSAVREAFPSMFGAGCPALETLVWDNDRLLVARFMLACMSKSGIIHNSARVRHCCILMIATVRLPYIRISCP